MNICMINGSIKGEKSSSSYLLKNLKEKLDNSSAISTTNWAELEKKMPSACDSIILAFPLYIDSIPSNMLECLHNYKNTLAVNNPDAKVYCVINNAFYEPENNKYGVQIIKHWCKRAGLEFGGALCAGAGPIIGISPLGSGPMENLDLGLSKLAEAVNNKKVLDDPVYVEPNLSKAEYLNSANSNWDKAAKKRGLTKDDLLKRL